MILHEFKGWALTMTHRVIHTCKPLGGNTSISYRDEYAGGLFLLTCHECGEKCPIEVDDHLMKVLKFIKPTTIAGTKSGRWS